MDELIICVAPYPGEKQEEKFPGILDTAQEVIRSHDAGASIAHLHVRDTWGLQTTDTTLFRQELERIRMACRIIIEASTGGAPEHTLSERCVSFRVPGVELGTLNLGSINMFDGVYSNPVADIYYYADALRARSIKPLLIAFDLSHFSMADRLAADGMIAPPHNFSLVFDVPSALPYQDRYLDAFLRELPRQSLWFFARHHAPGRRGFIRALELGGHVRVGYEDGPFLADGRRARSNAELVDEIARLAETMGRRVVDPDRARELMGILPASIAGRSTQGGTL